MRTKVDEWIEIINSQPIPKKWDNTSWLNDGCPSFIYKNLQIWVDHEDVNDREYEGTKGMALKSWMMTYVFPMRQKEDFFYQLMISMNY